jgi:hypothetical protein
VYRSGAATGPSLNSSEIDTSITVVRLDPGQRWDFQYPRVQSSPGQFNYTVAADPTNVVPELQGESNNAQGPIAVLVRGQIYVSGVARAPDIRYGAPTMSNLVRADIDLIVRHSSTVQDVISGNRTDDQGRYGPIVIDDPEGDGIMGLTAVVKLLDQSTGVVGLSVLHSANQGVWTWQAPQIQNIDTGTNVTADIIVPSSNLEWRGAAHVYSVAQAAVDDWYRRARLPLHQHMALHWDVDVAASLYDGTNGIVHIAAIDDPTTRRPDTYDDDIIRHEVAHHVQNSIDMYYTQAEYATYQGGSHDYNEAALDAYGNTSERMAFLEGWAMWWATELNPQGLGTYVDAWGGGSIEVNLESGRAIDGYYGSAGPAWETCIAACLWDLNDPADDYDIYVDRCGDRLNDVFEKIAEASASTSPPANTCRFLQAYYLAHYSSPFEIREAIDSVFCAHSLPGTWFSPSPEYAATCGACAGCTIPISGIEGQLLETGDLRVRPNPAIHLAEVTLPQAVGLPAELSVYDVRGRRIWIDYGRGTRGKWVWPVVDRQGARVPPGSYFVVVRVNSKSYIRRLCVVR